MQHCCISDFLLRVRYYFLFAEVSGSSGNKTLPCEEKIIYTIMPDYGDAYAWVKYGDGDGPGVGSNVADSSGWYGNHTISEGLHRAFVEWQQLFERQTPVDGDVSLVFDWAAFHRQGLELARQLKAEVGQTVKVFYEKPTEDPGRIYQERLEALSDGTFAERLIVPQ